MWIFQSTMQIKECKMIFMFLLCSSTRGILPFPATNGEDFLSFHIRIHCQDELVHGKQVAVSHRAGAMSHTQRGNVWSGRLIRKL